MIYAYIRVSSELQTTDNQRYELEQYAVKTATQIDSWIEETISSRKKLAARALGRLIPTLRAGDMLLITELSRIGRNLYEVMTVLGQLLDKGIVVYATKQAWRLGDNLISKVQAFGFTLAADIERMMISQRTKDGLARAKSQGVTLGHPRKPNSHHKLTGKENEIAQMQQQGMPVTKIGKALGVHRLTLSSHLKRMGGETVINKQYSKLQAPEIAANACAAPATLSIQTTKTVDSIMKAGGQMFAYIRVSTDKQTNNNQRLQISQLAAQKEWHVSEWCEEAISSRAALEKRDVFPYLSKLSEGDVLVVSEVSRIGRSMSDLVRVFEFLTARGVAIHSIRDGYTFLDDAASRTVIGCLSIAAAIERDLISQRTTEAVRYRRDALGVTLGRPKGGKNKPRKEVCKVKNEAYLLENKSEILGMIRRYKVATDIAESMGVSICTLNNFLKKEYSKTLQELRKELCGTSRNTSKIYEKIWRYRKTVADMKMQGYGWAAIATKIGVAANSLAVNGRELMAKVEGEDWENRKKKKLIRTVKNPPTWQNPEVIRGMLGVASVLKIAQSFKIAENTLRDFMKKHGISRPAN